MTPQELYDRMKKVQEPKGYYFNKDKERTFELLEALIAKKLPTILVGSIRADNIVRDAQYLHLYKQAGFERFLLGIENYNEAVLDKIKKNSSAKCYSL